MTARELPFLAVFGVVGVAFTQWLYYVAIGRLPVGIALVFEMTAPVLIALWVWLVRDEKVRSRLWAALGLSLSGLVLVAEVWEGGGSLDGLGVLAALAAAVCLATYYLMGERGTHTRDPVALTCWSFVAAALFWSVAQPWWNFDAAVLGERVPVSIGALRAAAVAAGRVDRRPRRDGAVLAVDRRACGTCRRPPRAWWPPLEPVLASVVAWLWVEQVLSGWQVLGGLVVLAGIGLAQTARREPVPTPLPETRPRPCRPSAAWRHWCRRASPPGRRRRRVRAERRQLWPLAQAHRLSSAKPAKPGEADDVVPQLDGPFLARHPAYHRAEDRVPSRRARTAGSASRRPCR